MRSISEHAGVYAKHTCTYIHKRHSSQIIEYI